MSFFSGCRRRREKRSLRHNRQETKGTKETSETRNLRETRSLREARQARVTRETKEKVSEAGMAVPFRSASPSNGCCRHRITRAVIIRLLIKLLEDIQHELAADDHNDQADACDGGRQDDIEEGDGDDDDNRNDAVAAAEEDLVGQAHGNLADGHEAGQVGPAQSLVLPDVVQGCGMVGGGHDLPVMAMTNDQHRHDRNNHIPSFQSRAPPPERRCRQTRRRRFQANQSSTISSPSHSPATPSSPSFIPDLIPQPKMKAAAGPTRSTSLFRLSDVFVAGSCRRETAAGTMDAGVNSAANAADAVEAAANDTTHTIASFRAAGRVLCTIADSLQQQQQPQQPCSNDHQQQRFVAAYQQLDGANNENSNINNNNNNFAQRQTATTANEIFFEFFVGAATYLLHSAIGKIFHK